EFEADLKQGRVPERLTGTPFSYIKKISIASYSNTMLIEHSKEDELEIDLDEHKTTIWNHLRQDEHNTPLFNEQTEGLIPRIKKPSIALLIVFGLTAYGFNIAQNIELGYTYEVVGRKPSGFAIGGIFLGLAETLGPIGMLLLGLGVSLLPAYFFWKALKRKGTISTLTYH
ncbi:MAG: hypothetical protein AAFV80_18655, partial [Bacteroidota bacterium]